MLTGVFTVTREEIDELICNYVESKLPVGCVADINQIQYIVRIGSNLTEATIEVDFVEVGK